MKIVQETPRIIIVKQGSTIYLAIGLAFIIFSCFSIFYPLVLKNKTNLGADIGIILFSSLVILFLKFNTVSLDKGVNKLIIISKSILGRRVKEYSLNKIKAIKLLRVARSKGMSLELLAVLESGPPVSLGAGSGVTKFFGRQVIGPEKTIGQKIANFLGVPFQETGPLTFSQAIAEIKEIAQSKIEERDVDRFS